MALDIIHSLIVDIPDGMVNRHEVMEKVAHELDKPFGARDSEAVQAYEREKWGTSSEAIESAAMWDAMLGDDTPAEMEDA